MKQYYVYIMASATRAIYVGVTNNLERRVYEHKSRAIKGFSATYNTHKLVHFEQTDDVRDAIEREKRLKGWSRAKKIDLIMQDNPSWSDLSQDWYG